jgi:peptidoglycan/LPS O-acetylase OafA/YrhL
MTPFDPRHRNDIDGLRAVAVLAVVAYHAFPNVFPGGFIGVDIFFVISGYLISSLILKNIVSSKFSFTEFYSRRINRLFPALILVLTVVLVLGFIRTIPEEFSKLGKHIFGGAAFVANYLYKFEVGYFDDAAESKPLLHLWSLGVEEQFYIIWPVVLVVAYRIRLKIGLLIFILAAGSFALCLYRLQSFPSSAFYMPQTRAWELLAGALVATFSVDHTRSPGRGRNLANFFSCIGLLSILIGFIYVDRHSTFPGWWALLPTLGTVCLILGGTYSWLGTRVLSNRTLQLIGSISYPLYLWHWVCLTLPSLMGVNAQSVYTKFILILISFVLSWVTFRFIEQPVRSQYNTPKTAILLSAAMATLGIAGLAVYYKSGSVGQISVPLLVNDTGVYPCGSFTVKQELCVFGKLNSTETVLVYGDSHAQHLTAALADTVGRKYRIVFISSSSCFFGNHPSPAYRHPVGCLPNLEQVKALDNQKFKAIIRSQRWHGYGLDSADQIVRAAEDSILAFGLHSEKIIIVGSTANVDLKCLKYNYYFNQASKERPCHSSDDSKSKNLLFISVTDAMARPPNVYFVYPYQALCPKDECEFRGNERLYYGDTHHLTKDGALLIMDKILQLIDQP